MSERTSRQLSHRLSLALPPSLLLSLSPSLSRSAGPGPAQVTLPEAPPPASVTPPSSSSPDKKKKKKGARRAVWACPRPPEKTRPSPLSLPTTQAARFLPIKPGNAETPHTALSRRRLCPDSGRLSSTPAAGHERERSGVKTETPAARGSEKTSISRSAGRGRPGGRRGGGGGGGALIRGIRPASFQTGGRNRRGRQTLPSGRR